MGRRGWGGVGQFVSRNSCLSSVPKRNLLKLDPIKNVTGGGGEGGGLITGRHCDRAGLGSQLDKGRKNLDDYRRVFEQMSLFFKSRTNYWKYSLLGRLRLQVASMLFAIGEESHPQ